MSLHSVILAGGSGTRFWPASRSHRPKQFLPLADGKSLIQATVDRVLPLSGEERTWILTNPTQARTIHDYLEGFPKGQILVEPEARDTAPCIALAAATIEARDPGASLVFMPADHVIEPAHTFRELMQHGQELADTGQLVTFGMQPTRPATGFGYIEKGERLGDKQPAAYRVAKFREKPDRETAEGFLASGNFLWNAGVFLWNYESLREAMSVANPELEQCMVEMFAAAKQGDDDATAAAFRRAPKLSIDFAVMERAPKVAVVEAHLSWSDVGSLLALDELAKPDAAGNASFLRGEGADAIFEQASRCMVYGETPQNVTLFGTQDLIVVTVDDAILVCPRERAEDLKQLVEALRKRGREDLL